MSDEPQITPEEADYFRTIEERFCALRGAPMLVSPRDWALMGEWWSQGIPLPVVLDSLEEVFAARTRRGEETERISSLAYTRHEVLRRGRLHREMTISRRGESEERTILREEIRRHLGRVARGLLESGTTARASGRENLARTLLGAAAEVRRIRKEAKAEGWNPMAASPELESLDAEVVLAADKALQQRERLRIEEEASTLLDPHRQSMQPEALRDTRSAIERRCLRRLLGIPRVSLLVEG